jgi:hypothetical protein
MARTYHVAWWNLENLFDDERSPRRTPKVARALGDSVRGWTAALRDRKVAQLRAVVAQMNGGTGPDLLGVCEVENEFALTLVKDAVDAALPQRSYAVVHADTSDERGIDVAFVYDTAALTVRPGEVFQHVVMRRTATREILQVNFTSSGRRTWAVFGNHWPSRRGGQYESAAYRAIAGETLAYFHQRTLDIHGPDTPALALGDFNDEPFDPSLVQHAMSIRQLSKVVNEDVPWLLNLAWPALGRGEATFFHGSTGGVLDQAMVNKNLLTDRSPLRADPASFEIVRVPAMVQAGPFPGPVPFGGMGRPINPNGFSDHFPVSVRIEESD